MTVLGPCGVRWLSASARSSADVPVAGVDAGDEFLLVGDAGQQVGELGLFGLVEGLAQIVVVGSGEPAELTHHLLPVLGEVQGVLASVSAGAFPAQEAAFFEVVDEADDSAGQQAQAGGQLLLTAAGVAGNPSQ